MFAEAVKYGRDFGRSGARLKFVEQGIVRHVVVSDGCRLLALELDRPLEERPETLVPTVALGSDQGGRYVLVVNAEDVVEQRKVETGPAVGDMTIVEGGLKPEDRVITSGLLRAIPGQKVDPQQQTAAK